MNSGELYTELERYVSKLGERSAAGFRASLEYVLHEGGIILSFIPHIFRVQSEPAI